jgi:hypothetical protein
VIGASLAGREEFSSQISAVTGQPPDAVDPATAAGHRRIGRVESVSEVRWTPCLEELLRTPGSAQEFPLFSRFVE